MFEQILPQCITLCIVIDIKEELHSFTILRRARLDKKRVEVALILIKVIRQHSILYQVRLDPLNCFNGRSFLINIFVNGTR